MKMRIKTSTFLSGLSKVNHVVNSKSPVHSLNGIYFKLEDTSLTLIGSDSDITIKCIIDNDLEIINTGSIVIPKFIVDITRKIDDEYLELELIDETMLLVKSNNSEFKINGISTDNYPIIDFAMNGDNLNLESSMLKSIISETVFATSSEEIRPVLTGVNMSSNGSILTCVATDSFRLAKKDIKLENLFEFKITVPSKCLNEVAKLLLDKQECKVYINQQRILFDLGKIIVQSRLISGNYPDVSKLLPSSFGTVMELNKKHIESALDRATIMSLQSNYTVTIDGNMDKLTISSKSQELGSIKENVDIVKFEGEPIILSFNSKYVSEALKSFNSEDVIFHFNGSMSPFIITNENDDATSIQLILPIKTY
ncbi:DNA polymerase III subunit beta [Mycoplasma sp. P36-A1]|uniref:DNA polymerase III subunit beta n=1 Tax=Mycoplasma sp. P36-A1 TaxID=3252900 RepID=UPI003C2DC730